MANKNCLECEVDLPEEHPQIARLDTHSQIAGITSPIYLCDECFMMTLAWSMTPPGGGGA